MAALTKYERQDLAECEAVIERALMAFEEFGKALADIRDRKLYREKYGNFEEYCQQRWGMKSSRARQLISAAMVSEDVARVAVLEPSNEAQTRPLAPLGTEERQDAWAYAVAMSGDDGPTGAQVAAAVDELADLRSAVTAAGGCWYSSRNGQHQVDLPDQPTRGYTTEQLRSALGVQTVEAEPVQSVTNVTLPDESLLTYEEELELRDFGWELIGRSNDDGRLTITMGLVRGDKGEHAMIETRSPSGWRTEIAALRLHHDLIAKRQEEQHAAPEVKKPLTHDEFCTGFWAAGGLIAPQEEPELPVALGVIELSDLAMVGCTLLNFRLLNGETIYTIECKHNGKPVVLDKNLAGIRATIAMLKDEQFQAAERQQQETQQTCNDIDAMRESVEHLVGEINQYFPEFRPILTALLGMQGLQSIQSGTPAEIDDRLSGEILARLWTKDLARSPLAGLLKESPR